jgi:hypothetical protein
MEWPQSDFTGGTANMFGMGIFEMLIVGGILAVMLGGLVAVVVVIVISMRQRGPAQDQFEALERENRRLRDEIARNKNPSA